MLQFAVSKQLLELAAIVVVDIILPNHWGPLGPKIDGKAI